MKKKIKVFSQFSKCPHCNKRVLILTVDESNAKFLHRFASAIRARR